MVVQSRRNFFATGLAVLALPAFSQTSMTDTPTTEVEKEVSQTVRHNISSFRALDWQPYVENLNK